MHERVAAIGPTVPLHQAADSLRWARLLLTHRPSGRHDRAEDRLTELLLLAAPSLIGLMAARRPAPLDRLTPKQRLRLEHTLLAHLQSPHGSAPELAERLSIHPQTARRRLRRLQELFGDALADADARFEMETVLRSRQYAAEPA